MRTLFYRYPVQKLSVGASLGNAFTFARLDACTNLKGLWSSVDNQYYVGEWDITISIDGELLVSDETIFTAESQTTISRRGSMKVEQQFFLPITFAKENADVHKVLRAGIFLLRLINEDSQAARFVVQHSITFPAVPCNHFTKQPPEKQMQKHFHIEHLGDRIEATTVGAEDEVRICGPAPGWRILKLDRWRLVTEADYVVHAGQAIEVPAVIAYSPDGVDAAREGFRRCQDVHALLHESLNCYGEILSRAEILVPDALIYRGLQWAKVNTARAQHRFRTGWGFTNDPPQDVIVFRDVAWHAVGADYIAPVFSHDMLALTAEHAFHEGGKITEYIHADEVPPQRHDYDLNINDNTPLCVWAFFHHGLVCEDEQYLAQVYPLMRRAGDWILSQMKEGLVWCTASDTGVRGICSWRNIISRYTLSGAVTEINAECYHALKLIAEAAHHLGAHHEASRFEVAAEELKTSINTQLLSEKTGLYLLNIDNGGTRHHDVTGDLIFPVIFGAADEHLRERILARLTESDFWTEFGVRTVSPSEENYDPELGYQLLGGVWPNLTAWVCYGLRENEPEKLAEGMRSIFKLSEVDSPCDYGHVAPGQFPERLHGQTFASRGMSLSPWMPPTYLWLGVEGLMGVRPTLGGLEISPTIPTSWRWIGVKNLPFRGHQLSAFLYEGELYCSHPVTSTYPVTVGRPIEVAAEPEDLFTLGFEADGEAVVLAACTGDVEGRIRIDLNGVSKTEGVQLKQGSAVLFRFTLTTEPPVNQPSQVT